MHHPFRDWFVQPQIFRVRQVSPSLVRRGVGTSFNLVTIRTTRYVLLSCPCLDEVMFSLALFPLIREQQFCFDDPTSTALSEEFLVANRADESWLEY